jgi:hypothetical protein
MTSFLNASEQSKTEWGIPSSKADRSASFIAASAFGESNSFNVTP